MKRPTLIISLLLIIATIGCLIYFSLSSLHKPIVKPLPTPQQHDTLQQPHTPPDTAAWEQPITLKGLPKPEQIDWSAEGAQYLPERPNQPVEVRDDEITLDDEGARHIVRNRINVMLDNDTLSMTSFASEFKALYPSDDYEIIYADPTFRRLQLRVPDGERESVKKALSSHFGAQNIMLFDESMMSCNKWVDDLRMDSCWYHDMINTPMAWEITMGRSDVVVAVLDDGFEMSHEELIGKSVMPFNVYTRDDDVSETPDRHGTHVAGVIAARANNSKGIAGVAPNCKIMPVKVYDSNGNCSFSAMLDAIMYAIYNRAAVVNISLETRWGHNMTEREQARIIKTHYKEEERIWKSVFSTASRNHTTVVVSAGNEDILAGVEPMQRSENVIVVAAVDRGSVSIRKTYFSNWGSYTDVSAPGSGIYSTVGRNGYRSMTGTSMASSIVSGAVALMKSLTPELTTKQIVTVLQRTGIPAKSRVGRLIQVDKALQCVNNKVIPPSASSGALQVLLSWENINDVDLYCQEPSGEIIHYKHPKARSGGKLEIDMNVRPPLCTIPIENIFWPDTTHTPKGKYTVYVSLFKKNCNISETPFEILIKHGNREQRHCGTVTKVGQIVQVCEFTVE